MKKHKSNMLIDTTISNQTNIEEETLRLVENTILAM